MAQALPTQTGVGLAQVAQVLPVAPQAAAVFPGWQEPPEQQPLAQGLPPEQPEQTLLLQFGLGLAQATQGLPPLPQTLLLVPGWHWPWALQQPLGHDWTLQMH
jgi:hypothetical protein